jgi:hypothetical protein
MVFVLIGFRMIEQEIDGVEFIVAEEVVLPGFGTAYYGKMPAAFVGLKSKEILNRTLRIGRERYKIVGVDLNRTEEELIGFLLKGPLTVEP